MSANDADRSDEHSAFAWIMSGTVGAVVIGGFAKVLLDRRRAQALAEGDPVYDGSEPDEVEGHPT